MRAFLTVLAATLLTASAWAQSPLKMSYQAVIRNTSDQLVINQPIGMRISILQGSAMGVAVYTETQVTSTNSIGLVSIEIGGGAGFDAINWTNGPYFIKTETDPEGGTNYTITNASQLLSVPYALHAKTAEALSGGITETDPVFGASPAKTISGSDIANWNSKQDKLIAGKNIEINGDTISATGLPPNGTAPGEMVYWNGNAWVVVPPGTYGKILYFCNGVPTWGGCPSLLTTAAVYDITATTATSGGYVTNNGGSPVTARGVCWSRKLNPTIANNHTMDGSDTGTFVSNLTNLTPKTTYYARTYATNSSGTAYGNEVSFTTISAKQVLCFNTPDGINDHHWSYKDFVIPEGYQVDSVYMDASRPGYPQDEYDLIIGYCLGKSSFDHAVATFPLDYTAITSPMYNTWLDLTNHSIKASGVVRVTLPTCNGAVWNALCFAISPFNHSALCLGNPDGINDSKWSYKDYVIPEGYKVDSVYMDASRPGYPPDKYDLIFAYLPGSAIYNARTAIFPLNYEEISTPMYNTWLDLTNLSINASGMIRVKLPTNYSAVWNDLCIAISELKVPAGSCGSFFTINHVEGSVAPVTKTVTYGTVGKINIPGDPLRCWITSNLGADHQATAVDDAAEASAGWYWQFNRKQGYKHDGTMRTPNTTWISSIEETGDWISANDPCALELGSGWRLPTTAEWNNVDFSENWNNWTGPWNSNLKLHAAGYLQIPDGSLSNRGITGRYLGQYYYAGNMLFEISTSEYDYQVLPFGFSVRCLKDESKASIPSVTTATMINITSTSASGGGEVASDGGAPVAMRGVCWSTSPNPTTSNSITSAVDGGTGAFVCNLRSLIPGTLYYARAFAINREGTAYGNEVSFTAALFDIGQHYEGGIIFYIDSTGQHGLIAAPFDQSTGAEWGCSGTLIFDNSWEGEVGKGLYNTLAIVNGCSQPGTAAQLCYNLNLDGYDDWFLPSHHEMMLIWGNRSIIGGFSSWEYWTSTEINAESAIYVVMWGPGGEPSGKQDLRAVRAIRAF